MFTVALISAGCVSSGRVGMGSQAGAIERLEDRARREAAGRRSPLPVAVVPGIEPEILAPRLADDLNAWLPLDEALSRCAALVQAPPRTTDVPAGEGPIDPLRGDEALRHYVKGRDAAVRQRHYEAITELQRALELDPNSSAVLRELARSYLALPVPNLTKAANLYERLVALEPDDREGLFTLGLSAADQRDFARAAALLARPRLQGSSFDHDPAADYLADFVLATALRYLGYDRAWVQLGRSVASLPERFLPPTVYAYRLGSLYRQRGEIWRMIGDAHCRLGEYEQALEAYRISGPLVAEPAVLYPRLIYAQLRLGRVYGAQLELLSALRSGASSPPHPRRSDDEAALADGDGVAAPAGERPAPPTVSDREVRLCSYLAEHGRRVDLLADAVNELYQEHPDDSGIARAAAALLDADDAARLMRRFIQRRPRDLEAVSELLGWLGDRDVDAAVELAVALVGDQPDLAAGYVARLAVAVPRPTLAAAAAGKLAPSPERALVQSRMLAVVAALGAAWDVCRAARSAWPEDESLVALEIELASILQESGLLEKAVAAAERFDGKAMWLARARARRAIRQADKAVAAAARAVELAGDDADALTELARAHAVRAARMSAEEDRRREAELAAGFAEQAASLVPGDDAPYQVLTMVYGPGGLFNDVARMRQAARRLHEANPESRLFARLVAQEHVGQQRYEQGLEGLLNLYDSDPTDTISLALAVSVWARMQRLDAAERWLLDRLRGRPGSPDLLEQWVRVQLLRDHADIAVELLQETLAAEPQHHVARQLLESAYRAMGEFEKAVELGEERLLSRPGGIRRELALASLYGSAEMPERAVARLRWVLDRTGEATYAELRGAVGIAVRLEEVDDDTFDPVVAAIVERTVERFPEVPLVLYGAGLRALARMGKVDERFEALAHRAAAFSQGESGEPTATAEWQVLAQTLVDAGAPAAAARALRVRLWAGDPLQSADLGTLARACLVADAAANQPETSVELLRRLEASEALEAVVGDGRAPTLPEAIQTASNIYSFVGNEAGALYLLQATIEIDGRHAIALNNLGYTRLEQGHTDAQTAAWIEQAYALAPEDANVLDTLGWLRYKQGRFKGEGDDLGAVGLIRRALNLEGETEPSPEVLDHLGDALWKLGDTQGAVKAWRQVVGIVDDPAHRDRLIRFYLFVQAREWGLLVADPKELYDQEMGLLLRRTQRKLAAVEAGGEPPVEPTFAQIEAENGD
jgi:tetratricopeptide (TPR) repeat protein